MTDKKMSELQKMIQINKRVEVYVKDILLLSEVYPADQEHKTDIESGIYHCLSEISELLDFELEECY